MRGMISAAVHTPPGRARMMTLRRKRPLTQVPAGLQRQHKGGQTDGEGADQSKLDGREGIGEREDQQQYGQNEAEDIFDQEQGCGARDVVDDAAALQHDARHHVKIRVQQRDLRHAAGGVASAGPWRWSSPPP